MTSPQRSWSQPDSLIVLFNLFAHCAIAMLAFCFILTPGKLSDDLYITESFSSISLQLKNHILQEDFSSL